MDQRQRCRVRELLRLQHNSIRWRHECIIDWWGLPQQSCCIHCRRTIECERRDLHSLPPGSRPGADLGCGTGRITAHLDSLGVEAFGIDLSPAMVNLARLTHPDASMSARSLTWIYPTLLWAGFWPGTRPSIPHLRTCLACSLSSHGC